MLGLRKGFGKLIVGLSSVVGAAAFLMASPGLSLAQVPDYVVYGDGSGGNVMYLQINGDGTFGAPQNLANIGESFLAARTMDVENDGDQDIIVVGETGFYLYHNLGGGQFETIFIDGKFSWTDYHRFGIAVGSFNSIQDNLPDFIYTNLTEQTLTLMRNNGDLTFTRENVVDLYEIEAPYIDFSATPTGMDADDLDNDGLEDLAMNYYCPIGKVKILRGDGYGGFTLMNTKVVACCTYGSGSYGYIESIAATIGDFDEDGTLDILSGQDDDKDSGQAYFLKGYTSGPGSYSTSTMRKPGELLQSFHFCTSVTCGYDTYLGPGGTEKPGAGQSVTGYFDADMHLDIVADAGQVGLVYHEGLGDGRFNDPVLITSNSGGQPTVFEGEIQKLLNIDICASIQDLINYVSGLGLDQGDLNNLLNPLNIALGQCVNGQNPGPGLLRAFQQQAKNRIDDQTEAAFVISWAQDIWDAIDYAQHNDMSVSGIVTDLAGVPVGGATVTLLRQNGNPVPQVAPAVTNAYGYYRLVDVPDGVYDFEAVRGNKDGVVQDQHVPSIVNRVDIVINDYAPVCDDILVDLVGPPDIPLIPPAGVVSLTCVATDEDNDPLTYLFTITPANGVLNQNGSNTATWNTPSAPGEYVIGVTVSDGGLVDTCSINVIVMTEVIFNPTPYSFPYIGNNIVVDHFNPQPGNDNILDVAAGYSDRIHFLLSTNILQYSIFVWDDPMSNLSTGDLATGDFNHDGNRDISSVSKVLLGDGTGNFTKINNLGVWGGGWEVNIADLDGDGYEDSVISGLYRVEIRLGYDDDTGRFNYYPDRNIGVYSKDNTIFDYNGDGWLDVVTNYNPLSPYPDDSSIILCQGIGGGYFARDYDIITPGIRWDDLSHGDFNNDNLEDIAAVGFDKAGIFLADPLSPGSFLDPIYTELGSGSSASTLDIADFNGDGILDLVVSVGGSGSIQGVQVLLGFGDGTFLEPRKYNSGVISADVNAADFDNDGRTDILVNSGKIRIFINQTP